MPGTDAPNPATTGASADPGHLEIIVMQFLDLVCIATVAALVATGTAHAQSAPATAPAAAPVSATAAAPGTLSLTFTGIEAKQGRIMIVLFDEAGWGGGRPLRADMVEVTGGSASVTIPGLPVGRYGIKAFHDVNGNGRMDTNPFGMPTEPFAFSNDARGRMGPAAWADAAFAVVAGANAQAIAIR